ncbi:hypothetical protein [Sanguibacteroides justesenii]|uniref:Carboxypeptidase-like regulatory domain-containing protein n=2 Tax=Sanguibacteroides justesenii TaxID=1547597 RepID=A0AB34R362_9PORP|nr:hypothetical protein [Sanguibacteroides justesenii]KIO45208.1 hypothetical protein IE90_07205 [Sanguibacteroides justesenii]
MKKTILCCILLCSLLSTDANSTIFSTKPTLYTIMCAILNKTDNTPVEVATLTVKNKTQGGENKFTVNGGLFDLIFEAGTTLELTVEAVGYAAQKQTITITEDDVFIFYMQPE